MQFIAETEVGGAGIVVDADRGAHCRAHRFEERVDLMVLQWLVGHGCQQQAGRTGILSILCQSQYIAGAQRTDAHDDRDGARMGQGFAQYAHALGFLQVGVAAGGAEHAHGVDASGYQALDQAGEGAQVDARFGHRRKRKSAEAVDHGEPRGQKEKRGRQVWRPWTIGIVYCPRIKLKRCPAT